MRSTIFETISAAAGKFGFVSPPNDLDINIYRDKNGATPITEFWRCGNPNGFRFTLLVPYIHVRACYNFGASSVRFVAKVL